VRSKELVVWIMAKRHPDTGSGLAACSRSLYEPRSAREAITALQAAPPDLRRQLLAQ
jgi:hypothetical protein